jgi:phage FluMu protein Com
LDKEIRDMKCPSCKESIQVFVIRDAADDYQDGEIICPRCNTNLGSFEFNDEYKLDEDEDYD